MDFFPKLRLGKVREGGWIERCWYLARFATDGMEFGPGTMSAGSCRCIRTVSLEFGV